MSGRVVEEQAVCSVRVAGRKSLQSLLLDHTHDFNIANGVFTLLPQILDRVEVVNKSPFALAIAVLEELRTDMDRIIGVELKVDYVRGTTMLMSVFNGTKVDVFPDACAP